jgi:hypothetical protein
MKRRHLLNRSLLLAAVVSASLLGACSTPQVQDYAKETPVLELRDYFNGTLDAYGIFTDRSGKVVKRFTVVMHCTWTGDQGVLDEAFTYADGSTQRRHLAHDSPRQWPVHRSGRRCGGHSARPAKRQRVPLGLHAGAAGRWPGN